MKKAVVVLLTYTAAILAVVFLWAVLLGLVRGLHWLDLRSVGIAAITSGGYFLLFLLLVIVTHVLMVLNKVKKHLLVPLVAILTYGIVLPASGSISRLGESLFLNSYLRLPCFYMAFGVLVPGFLSVGVAVAVTLVIEGRIRFSRTRHRG